MDLLLNLIDVNNIIILCIVLVVIEFINIYSVLGRYLNWVVNIGFIRGFVFVIVVKWWFKSIYLFVGI